MAAASPLRRWLRRHPQPVRLRVVKGDGARQDVAVSTGANCWAITEGSVMALEPSKVEALDATGVCLRAMQLDREDDDEDDAKKSEQPKSRLEVLARLLNEAHDNGAKRHADAYSLAFTKMTYLVELIATRLSGLESAWTKAMKETAAANANALYAQQLAEGANANDPADHAIQALLVQAFAAGAAAPKSNGAPKPAAPAKKGD